MNLIEMMIHTSENLKGVRNVDAVMNGEISDFMQEYLKMIAKK